MAKPILTFVLRFLVGVAAGFIINYFADVLPATRRLTKPACRQCQQKLSLQIYFLGQRCPACGGGRGLRFILVLIGAAILSALLEFFSFANLNYWASLPILIYLGVIVVIDIEHRLVLFETALFGLALFLVYGIHLHGIGNAALGALGGFGITLAFFLLGIVFTKVIGRIRGQNLSAVAFGFGDVSAGTVFGLLTGWPGIAGAIIIALLAFGVFSLIYLAGLLLTKRYKSFTNALPFAPFLVLGVVVLFYL